MISDLEKTNSKDHFVFFFKSLMQAYEATKQIEHKLETYKMIFIVIEEETRDNCEKFTELSPNITVYKGQAWTLIFDRRLEDGWYEGRHTKA